MSLQTFARGRSLKRVLDLAVILRTGRHTLRALAGHLDVSTRTIRRDLELLSTAGFPVRNTADAHANGINGFWWMERRQCPLCGREKNGPARATTRGPEHVAAP